MAGIVSKDIYRLVNTTTTEIDIMDRIYHGDVDAYNIDIEFHGVTSITGTCNLHFVLSDGTALDKDASDGVVIDGKNVKYTLPTYLYQKSGNLTMYVQFMNSNIYTPLKVNFKNIVAIPDGGKEVVATTTYPVWYDEVVTNEAERVAAELIRVSNEEDRGIGSRTYTEQNYVTNGETITASLDAIDTTVASHMAESVSQAGGVHGLAMERGTFTPAFGSTDNNGTVTYRDIFADYVRLGDLVYITIRMDKVSYSGGSGHFRISGLPFAGMGTRDKYNFVLAPNNIDKNNIGKVASVIGSILHMRPDSGISAIPVADFTERHVHVSGVYLIAN